MTKIAPIPRAGQASGPVFVNAIVTRTVRATSAAAGSSARVMTPSTRRGRAGGTESTLECAKGFPDRGLLKTRRRLGHRPIPKISPDSSSHGEAVKGSVARLESHRGERLHSRPPLEPADDRRAADVARCRPQDLHRPGAGPRRHDDTRVGSIPSMGYLNRPRLRISRDRFTHLGDRPRPVALG